ncbi:sensor histidine kinase [Acetobacter senegalensis]|uniref:sensor histidine kinase n=1 Tax=Acetobacter senegalensis TaxID=446692 RepID=UPI001EDAD575|nr:ATP-binding protein [Acetobacter senegalensis]MCG4261829.1 sensor histidine kinase [Acetobacter senegalensis]
MRNALSVMGRLVGIILACLLIGPIWQKGFFATAILLVCIAAFCATSLVLTHLEMLRRVQRREPSIVHPTDREKLRNRALLNHAPVPLLFQRTDGTLHAANRAARRLFETDGPILVPPEPLLVALENNKSGPEKKMIRLMPPSGGKPHVYALSIGQGGGAVGIVTYIALTDVEAGLNAAEAQALRDLLQILSHEIMNSLTPIVSLSATAEELFSEDATEDTKPLISEALATIRRRANGLDRFVRGYRDLARLPAPELKPVDLGELLQETARLFRARWSGRVELQLDLPSVRTIVRLDKAQMEQALLNLLNNGAEAALAQPSPSVQIAVDERVGSISIVVRDNGHGVTPEQRERIFQPFVSFKPNGNGIGLSLARQIVLGHGGTLILDEAKLEMNFPWSTSFRCQL